jgi:hypothetical protein
MSADPADRLPILVVPYCHADWVWTHTRYWHEERYTLVFEETLALLRDQARERAGQKQVRNSYCFPRSTVSILVAAKQFHASVV